MAKDRFKSSKRGYQDINFKFSTIEGVICLLCNDGKVYAKGFGISSHLRHKHKLGGLEIKSLLEKKSR